jgi:hypothetical protein
VERATQAGKQLRPGSYFRDVAGHQHQRKEAANDLGKGLNLGHPARGAGPIACA